MTPYNVYSIGNILTRFFYTFVKCSTCLPYSHGFQYYPSQFFPSKIWQFRFLPNELLWPSLTHSVTQSLMYPGPQKLCNRVFFLLSLNSTITLCTVNYERKHLLKFWLTFSFDSFNFNVVFLYLRWFNKCYVADVLLFCGLSVSVYMCA